MSALPTVTPPRPNIETVGRHVTVLERFSVRWREKEAEVPEGFPHDGASIPRVAGLFIQHDECGEVPPAFHDRGYRTGGFGGTWTRADVDAAFRDLMRLYGVTPWKREAAYYAVRVFGGRAWQEAS